MTLHLIKLAVGAESLRDLEAWQKARLKQQGALMHITRQTPKREDELLNGGSLYWVIKGVVVVRQRLLELRPVTIDGVAHCALVLESERVRTRPRPQRPFQGWRYLQPADAPRDLQKGEEAMSDEMRKELAAAGLL